MEMKTTRKPSVKKNYIYNLIFQIFSLIVPLFVTPYVARVLTSNGVGMYSYSFSIVTYFTLFAALGFGYYAQRYMSGFLNDKEKLSTAFWELFIVRLIPFFITLGIYFLLIAFNVYGSDYNILMLIMTINVIAVAFDISFFYQAKEQFGKIVLLTCLVKIVSIICIFIFVRNTSDLNLYVLIQSLCIFLSNIVLWVYLPADLSKISVKNLKPLKHLKPTIILFLPTIATTVYTTLDKTMIGIITNNPSENGNYEYADKIVKMALTLVTSLGSVMIARNSALFAENKTNEIINNVQKSVRFVFALGIPIMLGLIAISDNLIPRYLGEGYERTNTLLKIMSPLVLVIGLSNVFGIQYLLPIKQDKKYIIAIVAGCFVNLVLNIPLIFALESYGAAIASVISEVVVNFVMLIYIRKIINVKLILKQTRRYIVTGLGMFAVCYPLSIYLTSSILNTFLIVVVGAVFYGVALLILRDDFAINFLKVNITNLRRLFMRFTKKKTENGQIKEKKILVTGVRGQLGFDVCRELKRRGYSNIIGIDVDELDVTNGDAVHEFINKHKPDIIIHNAAWTAVDKAEENEEKVFAVNSLGTKFIAEAAKEVGAKMMYISTDYVFNGKGDNFFETDSEKSGLSVYGKTKSKGEDFVTSILNEYWIIRISWVFGINGNNFIKTMLKLAKTGKKELNVVDDQIGSPTYTYDLAKLMCDMIETDKYGIYHATNEGICSWYEFAKYIFEKSGYLDIKVNPVSTAEYKKLVPNQADRPLNSRLSKKSLDEAGFKRLPDWHDAVDRYLVELKEKGEF